MDEEKEINGSIQNTELSRLMKEKTELLNSGIYTQDNEIIIELNKLIEMERNKVSN